MNRFINSIRQINRVAENYDVRYAQLRGFIGWVEGSFRYILNRRFERPFDTYVTWYIRRAISGEVEVV
jgi:hypothetical protein